MKNLSWIIANLANFFSMSCHMSATLLPVYWKEVGFHDWEIGWLAAGFSSAAILARLGLGYGLERWGRKPFLILGAVLLTMTPGFYGILGSNFTGWVSVRLLQGVGLACYITAILTWVADRSPPERIGELQGVFGVSGLLGSAFGPWLSEKVYHAAGFQAMFTSILMGGLACSLCVTLLPETRLKTPLESLRETSRLRLGDHKAMMWVTFPFGWVTGTVITFIAPFVEQVGLHQVGAYFAAFAFASVGVRVFAADAIDRVSTNRLVVLSGCALSVGALTASTLGVTPSTVVLVVAALLNGLGHGFLFPGLSTHTVRRTSARQRGSGLALFTGTFDLGILAGALVAGYVSQAFGYPWAFAVASAALLCSLPLFLWLNRPAGQG